MNDPRRRPEEALLLRAGRRLLRFCAGCASRVPEAFIARGVQMALDAGLCAAALIAAYELRFDGAIPAAHQRVMWALLLLLPVMPGFTSAATAKSGVSELFSLYPEPIAVAVGNGLA